MAERTAGSILGWGQEGRGLRTRAPRWASLQHSKLSCGWKGLDSKLPHAPPSSSLTLMASGVSDCPVFCFCVTLQSLSTSYISCA